MWTQMDGPLGQLRIVEQAGSITAIEFEPFRPSSVGRPLGAQQDGHPVLTSAVAQREAYFARDLKEFDLPLAPQGSAFQQVVWQALCTVGYGETASYGEIAHPTAQPNA